MLISLDRTGSAMFAVQHQWRMKSTSCLNVQHTAERGRIFSSNQTNFIIRSILTVILNQKMFFNCIIFFNSKNVTVLKIFIKI